MKRTIKIRCRDGHVQRYHVGRKLRSNYGFLGAAPFVSREGEIRYPAITPSTEEENELFSVSEDILKDAPVDEGFDIKEEKKKSWPLTPGEKERTRAYHQLPEVKARRKEQKYTYNERQKLKRAGMELYDD